jgi:hypothetical protein
MTRNQVKNRVNKLIRENTSGLYHDSSWEPIHKLWKIIRNEFPSLVLQTLDMVRMKMEILTKKSGCLRLRLKLERNHCMES